MLNLGKLCSFITCTGVLFSDGDAVGREAVRRRLAKTHVHASWI
jgi:hypothetical protein